MEKFLISGKIPDNFSRYIVNCIDIALSEDCKRYMQEFHPDTTNGVPHCIHDWINGNLVKYKPNDVKVFKFNRHSWKSNMIIDNSNKIAYTVMRQKGLLRIKKKKRTWPHYLQTFVTILNNEFQAKNKQIMIDGFNSDIFSYEILVDDFKNLCGENLKSTEGYRHCLIAFDTQNGQLSDVKAWILDKDLDIVDELSLNEFIKPDYSNLTNIDTTNENSKLPQDTSNDGLLKFTNKSIIKIKDVSKQRNA